MTNIHLNSESFLTHKEYQNPKKRKHENNESTEAAAERQVLNAACSLMRDDDKLENSARKDDDVFGKLIASQIRNVGEGRDKEKLKMDLQKLIFNVLYPEPPHAAQIPYMPHRFQHPANIFAPLQSLQCSPTQVSQASTSTSSPSLFQLPTPIGSPVYDNYYQMQ